ncbi:MAG: hypothetical protein KKD38_02335, partial [Candidatus Delongbacteria bacterium]|nr:hypothetical protein [Candidatus Delongbacteria bacterium]MCG2759889.1 hypothetical protein [Candidatus Delongbacteria bacterium]
IPLVGTNVMKSGFSIPSSAVQGVLLHSLNNRSEDLASACFNNKDFRTWPLLPVTESRYVPCRLSSTHKISKLPLTELNGKHKLIDLFISEYDWRSVSKGSPLKGCDGVLFSSNDNDEIHLWRSSDMPRLISAHSVHESNEREKNFFTVESMAVKKYSGFCSMPESAAITLVESLKENPYVAFGKSRSIRGGGKISAKILKLEEIIIPQKHNYKNRLFILQSPVSASGRDFDNRSAEEILTEIVLESGWGEVEKSSASITVLFGWNRHKHGRRISDTNRLQSMPVIVPGSVFLLKKAVTDADLEKLLIKGLSDGKEQGLGAVLPHPGEAVDRFLSENDIIELSSNKNYAERAFSIYTKSEKLLSRSQIASLMTQRMIGYKEALDYLDKQKYDRPKKIWDRWNPVFEDLKNELLKEDAVEMLQVWHDLSAERK